MDENTFEYNGWRYKAVDAADMVDPCEHCAFDALPLACGGSPICLGEFRIDGRNVSWREMHEC